MAYMKQIRFTQQGYNNHKKEYEELIESRKYAVEDLQKARAMGDLSENGYYKAAKAKLGSIDAQMRRLKGVLQNAIIASNSGANVVDIGNEVTLEDEGRKVVYNIVGDLEADPMKGKISLLSPLGQAIKGKKIGEEIIIITPMGEKKYTLISIS